MSYTLTEGIIPYLCTTFQSSTLFVQHVDFLRFMNSIKSNKKVFGTICGILAAVFYGTNPLGALKLYEQGMTTSSVLFCRFGMAWIIVSIILLFKKESLKVNKREFITLTALGLLFIASSMTLYSSFKYIAAGVASTLLFTYPIMTAVIMALFFHERLNWVTGVSIALSFLGVALLYRGDGQVVLPWVGVVLVLLSALSYAVYIVVVNRSKIKLSPFKINFYVLLCCALGMLAYSFLSGEPITLPHGFTSWFYVCWLATVPAIMALVLLVYAARYAGSTTTAVLGALEPLTAVLIGIFVFGERFTVWLAVGIVLILASVMLVVAGQSKAKN